MLIFRYLAREIFITLASLTTILLLIFMSNQFVRYLNRAASGQIPGMVIAKLMMLEMPNLLGLLLPLGFYVAMLVAYGRLYADSEMTVLQACGYGPGRLLRHSLLMASLVSALVLIIMLWVSPYIAVERTRLLRSTGIQTLIKTIIPGRFQAIGGGKQVFYVEQMNRDHTQGENIFLARQNAKNGPQGWDIMWAETAHVRQDPDTYEEYLVLEKGQEYEGQAGSADYQTLRFDQLEARLPHPQVFVERDVRTLPSRQLLPFNNPDLQKAAELQWRLSIPLMVLTLTLVAVPLSRVNPRTGKFARLLPAILIYIIYANFMFVARNWIIAGKIPVWLGMFWLHALVAVLGLLLMWRNRVKPA
ncbi:MAG: LPS export ABC transporter permease LptF [Legionellaceae bacterium]|nr:LPS export ABC transporter permease LptF [Legionellaceae bacterium]